MRKGLSIAWLAFVVLVLAVVPPVVQADDQPQPRGVGVNCGNFQSQAAAQAFYLSNPILYAGLDTDNDGLACEGNNAPYNCTRPATAINPPTAPWYPGSCPQQAPTVTPTIPPPPTATATSVPPTSTATPQGLPPGPTSTATTAPTVTSTPVAIATATATPVVPEPPPLALFGSGLLLLGGLAYRTRRCRSR